MSKNHSVEIDKFALDEEWVDQPTRMRAATVRMADARRDMDYCKVELDDITATTYKNVRNYPSQYGLGDVKKLTEGMIEAAVRTQDKVRNAHKRLIEATHLYNVCKAEVDALQHRKSALEDLVVLWAKDYFSEPVVPTEHSRAAREKYRDQLQGAPRWRNTGVGRRDRGEE